MKSFIYTVLIVLVMFISPVHAYIGPGMSGGVIAAVLGVLAALILGLFGVLYYPIKRALKNRKSKQESIKKDSKQDPNDS